jgi:hypothetical protein
MHCWLRWHRDKATSDDVQVEPVELRGLRHLAVDRACVDIHVQVKHGALAGRIVAADR